MQEVSKITQDHFVKMPFPVDPIPQRIKASVTHHSKGEFFCQNRGYSRNMDTRFSSRYDSGSVVQAVVIHFA